MNKQTPQQTIHNVKKIYNFFCLNNNNNKQTNNPTKHTKTQTNKRTKEHFVINILYS